MKRLREYQLDSFYGVAVKENCVPGLTCQVRHGTRKGEPYSYLVFLQDGRIKWEIIPTISHNKRVQSLYIRHFFPKPHSQSRSACGTPRGISELTRYIITHEAYERGFENDNVDKCRSFLEKNLAKG